MSATDWQILGIEPTDDVRDIRRAYATALKSIDVEREPRRFVELRDAYDAVRTGRVKAVSLDPETAASDLALGRKANRLEIRRFISEIQDHLRSNNSGPVFEDSLADLTLRLLAEADLELVDGQVAIEEWLASTIASRIPRSDPMIRPVQAFYNWHRRLHGQYRPEKASVIIDRWRDLSYAEHVLFQPTGRHRRAFLALQSPPKTSIFISPDMPTLAAVERFFEVHGYYPTIANIRFDPDILMKWYAELKRNIIVRERLIPTGTPSYRIRPWALGTAIALLLLGAGYAAAL